MRSQPSDATMLSAALALEQVVVFAYHRVRSLQPSNASLLNEIVGQEQQHVQVLTAAIRGLGATPPPPPRDLKAAERILRPMDLGRSLGEVQNDKEALDFLIELEGAAEGAYFVVIPKLADPQLVRTAAQIMANEAQHAALLRLLRRPREPAKAVPSAFVEGKH